MIALNRKTPPGFRDIQEIKFPKITTEKLDNGIPVYLLNGGTQEVVKLDLMVHAGSQYSDFKLVAPITGLMLNEGTKTQSAHQIAESFDYYGAYFQPNTEKDVAFIGLTTLSKYLSQTLPVFTEVLNQSVFPQMELDLLLERRRQKFLVEQEKTSYLSREKFYEQVFGTTHPYGMMTTEDNYRTLTRQPLVDFYQKHYHAGSYSIVLSGKLDSSILKAVNLYLGQLRKMQKPEPIQPVDFTPISGKPIVIERENAVQSSIRTGLLTVNKTHPDYTGLKVLVTIFGGYFGSRLMKNLREDKGFTYGIHSMQVSFMQAGLTGVAADVKAEHTREAIDEIVKEMEKLKHEPVSQEELQLVRNYMMGELLQMFDGPFATSDTFKAVVQYGYNFEYFNRLKNAILTITPDQLMELANKYFITEKLTTVVAGKY